MPGAQVYRSKCPVRGVSRIEQNCEGRVQVPQMLEAFRRRPEEARGASPCEARLRFRCGTRANVEWRQHVESIVSGGRFREARKAAKDCERLGSRGLPRPRLVRKECGENVRAPRSIKWRAVTLVVVTSCGSSSCLRSCWTPNKDGVQCWKVLASIRPVSHPIVSFQVPSKASGCRMGDKCSELCSLGECRVSAGLAVLKWFKSCRAVITDGCRRRMSSFDDISIK